MSVVSAALVQLVGLVVFLAGIAGGVLLVFTDRHGYDRPVGIRLVLGLTTLGLVIFALGAL